MTPYERVIARCVRTGSCLVWPGSTDGRYGQITVTTKGAYKKRLKVHRVVYEHHHGRIPDGLTVDHVKRLGCRFKTCCEITHLEVVTVRENNIRGDGWSGRNARKTHCVNGHALSGSNLYIAPGTQWRGCRICRRRKSK